MFGIYLASLNTTYCLVTAEFRPVIRRLYRSEFLQAGQLVHVFLASRHEPVNATLSHERVTHFTEHLPVEFKPDSLW